MFYECEIEVLGSRPMIWRTFLVDCNTPVVELTKYIEQTMHLKCYNFYNYHVFNDYEEKNDKSAREEQDLLFVVPDKSIPRYKDIDGQCRSEKKVTVRDLFQKSDYSIFEYGTSNSDKFAWSLKISVLSRDTGIKHDYIKSHIVERESCR